MKKALKINLTGKAFAFSCFGKEEIMKTDIRGGISNLTIYVLFLSIILILSCASTSDLRLEGNDFKENLPGLWEGRWYDRNMSGKLHIKITGIDGNKVHLTGYAQGGAWVPAQDEVYGRVENSTLLLTWPISGGQEEYIMKRDDSENLILDGNWKGQTASVSGKVRLRKIE